MKKNRLCFLLFIFAFYLSKAGSGFVSLPDSTRLFFINNNEIYSPDAKTLLYFQKGNIFFNGTSDDRQNIFLLTTSMDAGNKKTQTIYEKDSREASYSFSDNKFYLGKAESDEEKEKLELIHVERMKKWLAFYASYNDTLLAYYNADSLPASSAIMVAYTLIQKFHLEKKLAVQQLSQARAGQVLQGNSYATIKPFWGNQTANEWIWDGQIFRPRWNIDPRLAWTFDGQTVKPYYGNNIYAQYSWDGETLKAIWRTNRAEEWSWDGRQIKPVWDSDWANQYTIENGIIKPWSGVHTEREWQMDGEIPMPLIILVISGIAKPY